MKVETVKFMMRKMALMGQNAFMLYTEDTYEIEGRPYFGYMRGRYTKDELRELDRKVKNPINICSYVFGIISAIIMGLE